jgi:hypothetical protein
VIARRRDDGLGPAEARVLAAGLLLWAVDAEDDRPTLDELPLDELRPVAAALLGLAADTLLDAAGRDAGVAASRARALLAEARALRGGVPDDARDIDGEVP